MEVISHLDEDVIILEDYDKTNLYVPSEKKKTPSKIENKQLIDCFEGKATVVECIEDENEFLIKTAGETIKKNIQNICG